MVKNCPETKEDATEAIHKFEKIIRNKKSDTVCLAYHQGKIF